MKAIILSFFLCSCAERSLEYRKQHGEKQPRIKEQIVLPEAKRGHVDVITVYED